MNLPTLQNREALRNKLIKEMDRILNKTDHNLAIEFLNTNKIPEGITLNNIDRYEILLACVKDFDSIYNDYCS